MSFLRELWEAAGGSLFVASLGLIYLTGKLAIRHIIHKLTDYEYDAWATAACFGVDLAVLTWSVTIGVKVPSRLGFEYEHKVLYLFFLVACTVAAASAYGFFIKRRSTQRSIPAVRDFRMASYLSLSWFFGLVQLLSVIRAIPGL